METLAATWTYATQQLVCVTGQETRTIEVPAVTMAALARHIDLCPPVEVEIWGRTDPALGGGP